jgi:hypothetical protein
LGEGQYQYMVRTLNQDARTPVARDVDVVVRKDGIERRVEADWLKPIAKLVKGLSGPLESRNAWERLLRRVLRWDRNWRLVWFNLRHRSLPRSQASTKSNEAPRA